MLTLTIFFLVYVGLGGSVAALLRSIAAVGLFLVGLLVVIGMVLVGAVGQLISLAISLAIIAGVILAVLAVGLGLLLGIGWLMGLRKGAEETVETD